MALNHQRDGQPMKYTGIAKPQSQKWFISSLRRTMINPSGYSALKQGEDLEAQLTIYTAESQDSVNGIWDVSRLIFSRIIVR